MCLVLAGYHSLDQLEEMARSNFGSIKRKRDGSAPNQDYSQE